MRSVLLPMHGLSRSDRRALLVGVISVGLMLGYAWLAKPLAARMTQTRVVLAQQKDLLSRERALVAAAPRLPLARQQADAALRTLRTRLFAGDSVTAVAALARYVDDVATANGMEVSSVEGRPSLADGALVTVAVELRGEGRWSNALGVVRTLESAGALVDVRSVRMEKAARGGDWVALTATLTGIAAEAP